MDRRQRLAILAEAASDDKETGLPGRPRLNEGPVGIRPVRLPGGGSTTLMRVMQTNACSLSCGYCPTFCGGRVKRTALSPEEVARTFMESHRAGVAQGLFLTSGVPGRAPRAVDRMLAAIEILRKREGFAGYVHIKLLPGAEQEQVVQATRLATRVSVNLEGPNDAVVRGLAREKDYSGDLLPNLMLAGRLSREARLEGRAGIAAAGTTTQFVVGAQGEQDREILERGGRARAARPPPPRPLQRLPAGGRDADGRASAHAGRARVAPLPGRAPAPAVRLPGGGAGLRRRRQPHAGPRSEDGAGRWPTSSGSRWRWSARPTSCCCACPASGPTAARRLVAERRRTLPRDARISAASAWTRRARVSSSPCAVAGFGPRCPPSSSASSRPASISRRGPGRPPCRPAPIAEGSPSICPPGRPA